MRLKTLIVLPIVFLVAACGRPPEQCELTLGHVYSDAQVDCAALQHNLDVARSIAGYFEHVQSDGTAVIRETIPGWEFDVLFSDVDIIVEPQDRFGCIGVFPCAGQFNPVDGSIQLGASGRGMLHEMFHAWLTHHGVAAVFDQHAGWHEAGLSYMADAVFVSKHKRLVVEAP